MEQSELIGKKILMIHNGGKRQAELFKHVCDQYGMLFHDIADKPNEGPFGKIAGRLHIRFYERKLFHYYKKAIDKFRDSFDYIIVIRGEYTPVKAIKYLREKNQKAKIILYMWDSIINNHGIEKKWPLFDKVFTFDRADYLNNKDRIGFIPLFYCEEYIKRINKNAPIIYDIAFIGTAHGDRAKIVKSIEKECEKYGLRLYKFLYSPHILVYYYNKLFNKDYKYISKKELSFKALTQKQIYEIYNQSKCVLDIEIKTQTGLTMRTMDILGLNKKMITTNHDIINYDFYRESNVQLLDRNNIEIDKDFLGKPYQKLENEIYDKYSMKRWLFQLLN